MYHPYASRSSPTTTSYNMMRNKTTTNNTTTCVAAVDGVILLEETQARHSSSGSSNDDDITSSHVSSVVSLVSTSMIASLENNNQQQQQQQQQCNIIENSKNSIGGLSFDDYDSIVTYDDDDDDDEEDEVTDISSLQTGASVFHLPPAAAAVVIPLYGGSSSSESSSRITTVTSSREEPLPYHHSFSNNNNGGGIMTTTTTTTTDDQEYSTQDEESTMMFAMNSSSSAMNSSSSASSSGDPINLGHATINTMSILALTKSNDPLDISHVVVQRGHGVATIIGPLGDELSYADAISNDDNHRRAGHNNNTELLAVATDDDEENRGRRAEKNNNILDESEDDDNYFGIPNLIAYSSKRVKIVLVTTVAVIVGMLVLTMVFSATAYNSSDNNGFDGITTVAALGESTTIVGVSSEKMTATVPTITTLPSNIPTTVTISPSITIISPSFEPTTTMLSNKVVDEAVGGKISFYLMADGGSRIKYWSSMLANLSVLNNHAFLVHLGSATRIVDNCDVNAYVRTKISLSASPIPVYSIPGDNDYPLCPDPSAGWKLYKEHFMTIDTMYWNVTNTTTSYIVNRQVPKHEENFAFLYKRVLFIGLNMVNNVNDLVKTDILKDNIDWVVTNVNAYWTNVDVIFLMGYGRLLTIENVPFKDALIMKARNEWSDKLLVYARRAATTAGTNTVANVTNFIELKVAPEWPIMEVSVRTRQHGSDDGSSSNIDNDDLPLFQYFAATSGLKNMEIV